MKDIYNTFYVLFFIFVGGALFFFMSCSNEEEMSLDDAIQRKQEAEGELLKHMLHKYGPLQYDVGKKGGTYTVSIKDDPQSFNIINVKDGTSSAIISMSYCSLVKYDPYKKKFIPNLATVEVEQDEKQRITYVRYTLKNNIYWRTASGEKNPVTADDIIFWYKKIQSVPKYHYLYSSLFIQTRTGEEKKIEIKKKNSVSVEFIIPEIIANPIYYTNMSFGPKYKFEELLQRIKDKTKDESKDYRDVFSLDMNVKEFPSLTGFVLYDYKPGLYIEYRNSNSIDYWKKDKAGNVLPYIQKLIFKIVKSESTDVLLFKQGKLDHLNIRIYQIANVIDEMIHSKVRTFDVYDKGPSIGASFITFNQNPNADRKSYKWFVRKRFRQAMSALFPREKIIQEVYNGLAYPADYIFSESNEFFDSTIKNFHPYNPERAKLLLREEGFVYKDDGLLYDWDGERVSFSFNFGIGAKELDAIGALYQEELKKVGITLEVKPLDFPLLVENITKSYKWDMIMVYMGFNFFPESQPALWLSNGENHLWNPLQKKPATKWEKKIDSLYRKGLYTINKNERKAIYDEYQKIILEQVPLFYTVHINAFIGVQRGIHNIFLDKFYPSPITSIEYLYKEK